MDKEELGKYKKALEEVRATDEDAGEHIRDYCIADIAYEITECVAQLKRIADQGEPQIEITGGNLRESVKTIFPELEDADTPAPCCDGLRTAVESMVTRMEIQIQDGVSVAPLLVIKWKTDLNHALSAHTCKPVKKACKCEYYPYGHQKEGCIKTIHKDCPVHISHLHAKPLKPRDVTALADAVEKFFNKAVPVKDMNGNIRDYDVAVSACRELKSAYEKYRGDAWKNGI